MWIHVIISQERCWLKTESAVLNSALAFDSSPLDSEFVYWHEYFVTKFMHHFWIKSFDHPSNENRGFVSQTLWRKDFVGSTIASSMSQTIQPLSSKMPLCAWLIRYSLNIAQTLRFVIWTRTYKCCYSATKSINVGRRRGILVILQIWRALFENFRQGCLSYFDDPRNVCQEPFGVLARW